MSGRAHEKLIEREHKKIEHKLWKLGLRGSADEPSTSIITANTRSRLIALVYSA